MAILEVINLKKTYTTRFGGSQVRALKNVNFTVENGEYAAVMGESGSGKTTLLNILAALDRPSYGTVLLDGRDITKLKDKELSGFRRDNLGFVFQDFNLLDTFSVRDNIYLPLVLEGKHYREMEAKILPVSRKLGITDILEKYPYEISGGQKQRAAVARALITNPRLILADEPTGALDSQSAGMLLDNLQFLNQELGATILMVTHDPLCASYSGRVLFLKDGKLFHELRKGESSRKEFFDQIIHVIALLGGDLSRVV